MADLNSFNPGIWAQAVQTALRNAVSGQSSSGFFQSRITRTPGLIDNSLDPQKFLAQYNPNENLSDAIGDSGLDEELKKKLLEEWAGKQGLMRVIPGAPSRTFRHESLHDIYQRGNLDAISEAMAGALRPETSKELLSLPVYQEQAARMGLGPTIANEGAAFELADSPAGNPTLAKIISKYLASQNKPTELSQFKKLTKR